MDLHLFSICCSSGILTLSASIARVGSSPFMHLLLGWVSHLYCIFSLGGSSPFLHLLLGWDLHLFYICRSSGIFTFCASDAWKGSSQFLHLLSRWYLHFFSVSAVLVWSSFFFASAVRMKSSYFKHLLLGRDIYLFCICCLCWILLLCLCFPDGIFTFSASSLW